MVTAHDPDDPESPRVARHLARFQAADRRPTRTDLGGDWQDILADRTGEPGEQINVVPRGGLRHRLLLAAGIAAGGPPVWLFAAGPPDEAPFQVRWSPG